MFKYYKYSLIIWLATLLQSCYCILLHLFISIGALILIIPQDDIETFYFRRGIIYKENFVRHKTSLSARMFDNDN